jgi:hypothetical protein
LLANDAALTTVVYVHGNRYEAHDAIERGWIWYHTLCDQLPPEQNVRLIIWSWPTETDGGPIHDARRKTCRTGVEAYYLAAFLTHLNPDLPTSILSYSLGGRVVLGAVHMAAGGAWEGRVATPLAPVTPRYKLAMVAPAVEDDCLRPGARFEMAMSLTANMYVTINQCDPILKRFHFVDKCERPTAMGYTGVAGMGQLGDARERIVHRNVCESVGRTHYEVEHLASGTIVNDVRRLIFAPPAE